MIAVTETWLDHSRKNSEFLDERFTVYRKDRSSTSIANIASIGGGVLIAVRNNIKCEEYTNNKFTDLEAVCVRISTKFGFMYIYCLYIQPTATLDMYRQHIDAIESITSVAGIKDTVVVLGDFNLCTTKWLENDSGFDYLPVIGESQSIKAIIAEETTSRLLDCGLFQLCNFTNSSGNVLDLIYTNHPELAVANKADFLMLPPFKSDKCHTPIMCSIDCAPSTEITKSPESVYCFKKANYDQIRDHLFSLHLNELFVNDSG